MVAKKHLGALALVWLIGLLALGAGGCSDDLYSGCTPDEDLGCEDANSCVARPNFECSTRVCGKFEGSDPYCTQACTSDGDCPNGSCEILVYQKGQSKFCVPSDQT